MLVLVKANVLVVGLGEKSGALKRLPIRVSFVNTGRRAGRSLKNENVDSVISAWDLPDAADGRFLKSLRLAKPYMSVIVIVESNDIRQEIAARSIGAAAVLSSDVTDEVFIRTLIGVLGLGDTESIQKICAVADDSDSRRV
jgi:DNA-binding NarL/FixJ family response regulator